MSWCLSFSPSLRMPEQGTSFADQLHTYDIDGRKDYKRVDREDQQPLRVRVDTDAEHSAQLGAALRTYRRRQN